MSNGNGRTGRLPLYYLVSVGLVSIVLFTTVREMIWLGQSVRNLDVQKTTTLTQTQTELDRETKDDSDSDIGGREETDEFNVAQQKRSIDPDDVVKMQKETLLTQTQTDLDGERETDLDFDTDMGRREDADEVDLFNDAQQQHYKSLGWIDQDDVFTPFTRFLRPPMRMWNIRKIASRRYLQNPENKDALDYAQNIENLGEEMHRKNKELRRGTFEQLKRLNQTYPTKQSGSEILIWIPGRWRSQHDSLLQGAGAAWLKDQCPVKCRATTTEWEKAHVLFHVGLITDVEKGWPVPKVEKWQARAVSSVEPHVMLMAPAGVPDITMHFDYYSDLPRRYSMCFDLTGDNARARFRRSPKFDSQHDVSAATFVSNCAQPRRRFMEKLAAAGVNFRHYGKCLHNKNYWCKVRKYECKLRKCREHRFSFGLESELVGRYASEKFGHMLCHSGVNVYYGSPGGLQDFGVPIVEAMDYYSEKELAEYLHEVGRNRTLFQYYTKRPKVFKDPWIQYRLEQDFKRAICAACLSYIEKGFYFKRPA